MKKIKPSQLGPTLRGLSELAGEDFTFILQKLTLDGFRALVRRSATDTGYFRSNWAVEVDRVPPETPLENPRTGKHAAPSAPAVRVETGSKVILYNNTVYAIHLEDGTPRMAAQPTVMPVRLMLEDQATALSKALSKRKYDV